MNEAPADVRGDRREVGRVEARQVEIKGPKMGQIGGTVAPLAPPEAPQASPAPHWV